MCPKRRAGSTPVSGTEKLINVGFFYFSQTLNSPMKIQLVEPYFTGSHKQWAEGYQNSSRHNIKILSIKGQFWKWRMHGGAVTLAHQFNDSDWDPDLLLVTDMLDLSTFLALTRNKSQRTPAAIYFHENQLVYPWSPDDRDLKQKRDTHYGFINYVSALVADKVFFNTKFHMDSFLEALQPFLKQFPDNNELDSIPIIRNKSEVLHLGIELKKYDKHKVERMGKPLILWNHRWEYDKNPDLFFSILKKIKNDGYGFKLAVIGENFSQYPEIFEKARITFQDNIVQWGYIGSFKQYAEWLWKADILPVTSNQEFFGVSVMEAIYCQTWPILPNRLSYPELIPNRMHKEHLYSNDQELYKMIVQCIIDFNKIKSEKFTRIAKKFDWDTMSGNYDSLMGKLPE